MLITESYRKLNTDLHAAAPDYGTSGASMAEHVLRFAGLLDTQSILDYGCGKRTLQRALGFAIENYDPAIKEYSARPAPAEIVVCADVLEHVEPECIDAVLYDLRRLTANGILLAVATGPALKKLPDGRNAHILQRPLNWWLQRIEQRFSTIRYWTTENGFIYFGRAFARQFEHLDLSALGPPVKTTQITVSSIYTEEQRCANIRSAMLRRLPSIVALPPNDKIMILACYGPSLEQTIPHLKREKGDVYSVSGAHDVFLKHGIIPRGHIESDPRPHKAKLIRQPHAEVCYFLASACDRAMFDRLNGFERWLFHVTSSGPESNLIADMDRGGQTFTIDGGTNVGMTAIGLGTALGYRKFSVHGMDCSFRAEKELLHWPRDKDMPPDIRKRIDCHAGSHPNEDQQLCRVWVGDEPFITSPQMLQGAQDFLSTFRAMPSCRFQLHGDGYLRAFFLHLSRLNKRIAA